MAFWRALMIAAVAASPVWAKGDVERGRAIAIECFACHGKDGNAPSPVNPMIGGQHERYLVLAMKDYKSGARKESLMRGAVLKMTDQEIEDVAAYYAAQKKFTETGKPGAAPQQPQQAAAPAGPGAFRVDKVERKATFVALLAAAQAASKQAKPLKAACPKVDVTLAKQDSDGDGLADAYDAAPNNADEFTADTNNDGRFELCSIQQMQAIVTLKSKGLSTDARLKRDYELGQDIDAASLDNFTPIGSCGPEDNCMMARGKYGYAGVFDGRNHTVRNLKISAPQRGGVGLFGVVGETGMVLNLKIDNAAIEGRSGTGGVVGANMGVVYNVGAKANIKAGLAVGGVVGGNSGLVALCSASGDLTAQQAAGGVVGDMTGGVYRCTSDMTVSGNRALGGLVGLSTFGMIFDSSSAGVVNGTSDLGGLVGMNTDGSINNSSSNATVNGQTNNIGGLVGFNSLSVVRNSYANGSASGSDTVGGLVGRNNGQVRRSYAVAAVKGNTNTGALVGLTVDGEEKAAFSGDALKTLDAEKSGWSPKVNISHDMLDFYCDADFSGAIEPKERKAENYVWAFDKPGAPPTLRCGRTP
jgi:cytochrome c553